jgi:sulfatase maturation enzyme AslB (radical SAM superfamily)
MDYPKAIHIETTGRCNSKCKFCPHDRSPRKNMDMSPQLFNKILRESESIPKDFVWSPFKLGEPTLDPWFSKRLLQVDSQLPHAVIEIHTNLNHLPKDLIPALRKIRRVTHFWVSLNHCTAEDYREETGLDFIKTVKNIQKLVESDQPHKVNIGRVATYSEQDNVWMAWVKSNFPTVFPALIARGDWCDNIGYPLRITPPGTCDRTKEISICCDGRVSLCCMDGLCEYPLGDVSKQHLLEVFNNPQSTQMRQMTERVRKPCSTCTFI